MKPLIAEDSILYKKRLVRELNDHGAVHGFYAPVAVHVVRCNRAAIRGGVLVVRSPMTCPAWFQPSSHTFTDPNGRQIVASRSPR